jgi:hypothetical protein
LRRLGIAAVALAATLAAATAQGMKSPRISHATVDWDALEADLGAIEGLEANAAAIVNDPRTAAEARAERLGRLNLAMGERFGGIAASPVPVLLPFETAADLRDRALARNATADAAIAPIAKYLSGFQAVPFFHAGPGGYDAVVVARGQDMRDLRIRYSRAVEPNTVERPDALSTDFTYHSPGHLLSGTGFKGKTGVADYTVSSKIRFPLADAPAFANSQSFTNWGKLRGDRGVGLGMRGRTAAYRCKVNSHPLIRDESAPANFSYPWRDNFCEHRFFFVGQCPGGLGHQGQDIRPASCKQRIAGANRREPYLHEVVAVREWTVLRAPGTEALFIVVNAPNERMRASVICICSPSSSTPPGW